MIDAESFLAIVFAAGFILGTIRTLVLVPHLGPLAAVLLELPLMLGIAWAVCRWLLRRFAVGEAWTARLAMGAIWASTSVLTPPATL